MQTTTRHFVLVGLSQARRELVRRALGVHNSQFHRTDDEDEAVDMAVKWEPSLVVAAPRFPGGNGYTLCRTIKIEKGMSHVGFILLGDSESDNDTSRAIMSGLDRFITAEKQEIRISELAYDIIGIAEQTKPLDQRRPAEPVAPAPAVESQPATPEDEAADPFRDFFADEPDGAKPPAKVAATVAESGLKRVRQEFENLAEEASDEIGNHIEQWLSMHFGERVDESMRLEVGRALQPLVRTILQNRIKKITE
jgi:CheY-like chemotaxis protein